MTASVRHWLAARRTTLVPYVTTEIERLTPHLAAALDRHGLRLDTVVSRHGATAAHLLHLALRRSLEVAMYRGATRVVRRHPAVGALAAFVGAEVLDVVIRHQAERLADWLVERFVAISESLAVIDQDFLFDTGDDDSSSG
jgi:hypothetical protein